MNHFGDVYSITNCRDTTRTESFTYDTLNRIKTAQSSGTGSTSWGEDYSSGIDPWGNLTNINAVTGKMNHEALSCASANTKNQLNTCYSYDAAGNLTQNGSTTYTYDAENRLTALSTPVWYYVYDGDGNRVEKCTSSSCPSNGTGTAYWRTVAGATISESGLNGTVNHEYIFFGGQRVARRDIAGNTVHYYFSDHLGTHAVVMNAAGTQCEQDADYYPYGGVENDYCTTPVAQNYKFTGKERDTESGLDNFGARYFASTMGRFMSPDWAARPTTVPYAVFGDPQSLNLYNYVRNDPLSRVDPDGHYEVNASGCGGNNQAKCQKKYDKTTDRFEKARQKDLNSKDPKVRAAAAAYGDRGAKNGVHVGFEDLHGQGIKGEVGALSSGKGKLIDVEVTIDSGLKGKSLQETVAHEGSHVGDDINFLTSYNFGTGKYDSGADFTGRQTEFRGYQAGAGVSHEHGFGPNDAQQINDYITNHYEQNYLNNNYFPDNANFPQ